MKGVLKLMALITLFIGMACDFSSSEAQTNVLIETKAYDASSSQIIPGAERIALYHTLLKGKKLALVVNIASTVGDSHLLDTLLELDLDVQKIFVPEHGFRGMADAGQHIDNEIDKKTGIPIISLYGKNRKPQKEHFEGIDYVVYDLQDVGVRFYTYISTLYNMMQSCAEVDIPLLVLDRPNPNGFYVDGPVLDLKYQSFVGMVPVPVVHGMTLGECAKMFNGENWLDNNLVCELQVIECLNYNHKMTYELPHRPSPNLPNLRSILLYPSLCFFEPTIMSVGRGTLQQFQLFGHPKWPDQSFHFKPISRPGASSPKHENKLCYGVDLTGLGKYDLLNKNQLNLGYLIDAYKTMKHDEFFTSASFFDKLAGNSLLREQIQNGLTEEQIRATWEPDLSNFKTTRKKYLLYKDFE